MINKLLELQTMQAITIYAFLLVIFLVILRYLVFGKEIENKGVSKIIGGLAVFIVALISQNPLVVGTSLFIGGLIIASEEFMQKLAIILRSESKDIGENLKPVSATPQEIKQKQKQEIQETVELLHEKKLGKRIEFNQQLYISYKNQVLNYWDNIFRDKLETNIRISNEGEVDYFIDGIVYGKDGNEVLYFLDIKILPDFKDMQDIISKSTDNFSAVISENLPLILSLISLTEINSKEIKLVKKTMEENKKLILNIFEVKNKQIFQRI